MALTPRVALSIQLAAIMSRNQFTRWPEVVIDELREVAGDQVDVLAEAVGIWVGARREEHTERLCAALVAAIPECEPWIQTGRDRRSDALR